MTPDALSSTAGPTALDAVADSRTLSGSIVAHGTVFRPGSRQPANGAFVYLAAWPKAEVLADLREGDPLELTPIAKTEADKAGQYALRIDPEVTTDHLWSDAGTMDVDVVAMLDGNIVPYGFSIVPDEAASDSESDVDPQAAHIDKQTGEISEPLHVDIDLGNLAGARLASDANEEPDADDDDGANTLEVPQIYAPLGHYNGPCPGGAGLKRNYGGRWVNVGSIHIGPNGKSMKFTYTGSASSTLGVGVSTSGTYGTFSANGTVSRSRSNTTSYPWYTAPIHRHLDTQFSYGKFCVEYADSMHGTGHNYQVRSIRHEGGTRGRDTRRPSATYCVPYNEPGSGGTKSTTNAKRWARGAKLEGAIGIDLSSRTGYRTNAKIDYVFRTRGRLCGTHDLPNGKPRRLMMKKPS